MGLKTRALVLQCLVLSLASGGMVKRSDDVSLETLRNLLQQQATSLAALEAKLTALQNEVTHVQNEVTHLSTAVAFTAAFSTDPHPLTHLSTLKFEDVITNVGNGYDPSTGRFTAPVTGVYAFSLNMMVQNNNGALALAIVKQGVVLDETWVPHTHSIDDQGSADVATRLTAGEQVWVRQEVGSAIRGLHWTVFTGYLLQAQ